MAIRKEDIDPLANSLKQLVEAEKLSRQEPNNVDLRRVTASGLVIVEYARSYNPGIERQLHDIELRLAELEKRSAAPSGLRKFIHSLIRIGIATIAGAAMGAPLGAWLVHDEIVKEAVKAAIAASISQTCMEVAEAGLDRRSTGRSASHPTMDWSQSPAHLFADPMRRAEEQAWGWGWGPAAGDGDARAR